jgi:Na+:H+ antiporter, NhaA family
VTLGIVLGLVVGKQLGITLLAWLAVRSGVAELPEGISWRHVYAAGWLAGIGFTMSLFITDLAFSEDSLVEDAKLGILGASLIAGVVGWMILRGASRPR